jgi:septum formation protein
MHIILGSQSQGRRELLSAMGYAFAVMPANIDARVIRSEDPGVLTLALAHAKADALLPQIHEPALLITSDQVVV